MEKIISIINASKYNKCFDSDLFSRVSKYSVILNDEYEGEIDKILEIVCLKCFLDTKRDKNNSSYTSTEFFSFLKAICINLKEKDIEIIIDNNIPEYLPNKNDKIAHDAINLAHFSCMGIIREFRKKANYGYGNYDAISLSESFNFIFDELYFPLSQRIAEKELKFINLFEKLLIKEPIETENYSGNYIVLEGNSGTGKTTQAEKLKEKMEETGKKVTIVQEPTEFYKDYEKYFEEKFDKEFAKTKKIFRLYSILGDRYQQINDIVYPELHAGNIVISVRSYLSMLVYQCETDFERSYINYLHQFVPRPDVVIIFDADEGICLDRAKKRNPKLSIFDKEISLQKYRPIYQDLASSSLLNFPIEILDVSCNEETILEKLFNLIRKYLDI